MSQPGSRLFAAGMAGAGALGLAGAALALSGGDRLVVAAGVLLAYAGFCAAMLLPHWRRRARGAALARPRAGATLVAYASQTGFGEQLAMRTAQALQDAGVPVQVLSFAELDGARLAACRQALFVVSTTGDGDAPDAAAGFASKLARGSGGGDGNGLAGLRYGILALGDSSYARFCAFGHALSSWLARQQAIPLFDMVEVDNGDTGALRHWQNHLSTLAGGAQIADWEAPRYARWRLRQRRLLNPGSAGAPVFHLSLVPEDGTLPAWQAGDIAEIGPRHAAADVRRWLDQLGLDGTLVVRCDGEPMTLADALATRMPLPEPHAAAMRGVAPKALVDALPALPHREYSISSLPGDGTLDLLVRQARHDDGRLGLASGWLTAHAPLDGAIALRVRTNRAFHPPEDARPLILIGNGTGMAGLRAHLKARAVAGHGRNWLLFGERSAAHDAFHRDEIAAWRDQGVLERVDHAWSRDPGGHRYVQDAVRAAAPHLREWIAEGAAVYVCGSLKGMAGGVDEALAGILGRERLAALADAGRYRRDVY